MLILLLLMAGGGRDASIDRSGEWAAHDYAVYMAKVDFPPGSRGIGIEGEMTALKYMQQAEQIGLHSYVLVSLAFMVGIAATFAWWRSADQAR